MSTASPIRVQCSNCGNGYKVKSEAVGRMVKCPKCGTKNEVFEDDGSNDIAPPAPEPTIVSYRTTDQDDFSGLDLSALPGFESNSAQPQIPFAQLNRRSSTREFLPTQYPLLTLARLACFVCAGLITIGWACWLFVVLGGALFSSTSKAPEAVDWPSDVPVGTSIFDPDITDAQRDAVMKYQQYEMQSNTKVARGTLAAFGLFTVAIAFIPTLVSVLIFTTAGELIRVVVDVQENTEYSAFLAES